MTNSLISENIDDYKGTLRDSIQALLALTKAIGHDELKQTVQDILERVDDPFMFVIVGEVKAGKSSFVNALLNTERDICAVAASPMTDTIQQIVYGEEEKEELLSPYLKRISYPEEILKNIAIVDTPGTNTIIDHHQEITERFIPASDLIIFVFESKNPYRQSAWEFFDYINEDWRKKIIFVLQQKDLMNDEDLSVNTNGVHEYAIKKGISQPVVFAVSAKMEQENEKETSGFEAVRAYIEENVTGGKAPFLKLENAANTSLNINEKIDEGVAIRRKQFDADSKFRLDIKEILNDQEERTGRQIIQLVENLVAAYDRISNRIGKQLKGGLGFFTMIKRSFGSMFGGKKNAKEWLDTLNKDFELELNTTLKDKLQEGVIDIAESIQNMGKMVDMKIKSSQTILRDNHDIFSDIAERRANVLKDLQKSFSNFLSKSENFYDDEMLQQSGKMAPNLAAGSGIAIVGVILATVTNGAVFDVTGGILTTIGLLFAGVTLGLNRSKIMNAYYSEIEKGSFRLEEEVSAKLKDYTVMVKQKIDNNFLEFDRLLIEEQTTLEKLETGQNQIKSEIQQFISKLPV